MGKFVPAWDKRTGRKLPNDVPERWLRKGTFPNLVASPQAAAKTTPKKEG